MSELLQEALRIYNFPLTVLFGLVLLFWILTIFGAVDTDSLEPDIDVDADVDVDMDADADLDADAHAHHSHDAGSLGLFRFFNLGEIPLMVLVSVLITLMWAACLLLNYYYNPGQSLGVAFGFLCLSFIGGLFLTKFLTAPLKPMMRSLKAGEKHRPVVGRTCVIKTSEVTTEFGQAEAEDDQGAPILINVRISDGQPPLSKGDQALVVDLHESPQTYLVRKLDSSLITASE